MAPPPPSCFVWCPSSSATRRIRSMFASPLRPKSRVGAACNPPSSPPRPLLSSSRSSSTTRASSWTPQAAPSSSSPRSVLPNPRRRPLLLRLETTTNSDKSPVCVDPLLCLMRSPVPAGRAWPSAKARLPGARCEEAHPLFAPVQPSSGQFRPELCFFSQYVLAYSRERPFCRKALIHHAYHISQTVHRIKTNLT